MSPDIKNLSRAELERWCMDAGEPPYRAAQILAWVHRKGAADFAAMSSLPRALRARETFLLGPRSLAVLRRLA